MKNYILIFFSCFTQCLFAQNTDLKNQNTTILSTDPNFEVAATFPDGEEKFKKYVTTNLKLTELESKKYGRIIMSFTIGTDGFLTDIRLTKNTLGNYGEKIAIDAIRVLSSCPKWNPATKGGKPIRMEKKIPIYISND